MHQQMFTGAGDCFEQVYHGIQRQENAKQGTNLLKLAAKWFPALIYCLLLQEFCSPFILTGILPFRQPIKNTISATLLLQRDQSAPSGPKNNPANV
jgi:hypothetical protein